jgi:hypothetical protein
MIEKIDKNDQARGLSTYAIIDKVNEIIDFLNGTYLMDVADGNYVSCGPDVVSDGFVTGVSIDDYCIDNMARTVHIKGDAKCPHCGESYYIELYNFSTAVYFPPTYKDGVNINPDMNKSTTHCQCLSCNKEFDI